MPLREKVGRYYVYAGDGCYVNWKPEKLQPGFIPYAGCSQSVGSVVVAFGLPENTFGRETAMYLCALARRAGRSPWLVPANNLVAGVCNGQV